MLQPTAEQANRSFMETFAIGKAIDRFGPKNQQLIDFVDKKNEKFWQKQPYQHEYALVKMFIGFNERNNILYPEEINDVINIFRWINGFEQGQFPKQEKIKNRPNPLFIADYDKLVLDYQLSRLKKENFLQQPDSMNWLNSIFKIYIQRLINTGIINDYTNILEEPKKSEDQHL